MKVIKYLEVYLEKKTSRIYVGKLYKDEGLFIFEYDKKYAYSARPIPIGPNLALSKRVHSSESLFASFVDRIPSKENPAYKEYCQEFGLSPNESNEILLLGTIGSRGPSSFVFELLDEETYTSFNYSSFRDSLSLSLRDFSSIFQISMSTLQNIEKNKKSGKEALKRIEIYDKYCEVALFEIYKNKRLIHAKTFERVKEAIEDKKKFKENTNK